MTYSNFIALRPICVFLRICACCCQCCLGNVLSRLNKGNALHFSLPTFFLPPALKVRMGDYRINPPSRHRSIDLGGKICKQGFSLVEMLTALAIISILAASSAQLVPSLFRANQVDANVATLSGILEQAREAAVSNNTFVWVAFTGNANNTGTWVATIQSQDGTDSSINQTGSTSAPIWATTGITVPGGPVAGTYLQLPSKLQNLPGVTIVDASSSTLPATLIAQASAIANATALFEPSGMQWTVTPLQNTSAGSGVYFTHAIEFTPDGDAHVQGTAGTWYSNIQFGLIPTRGTTSNSVLYNISRLTGKVTVYRP